MKFLEKVARNIWSERKPDISQCICIFPNKRAGNWFLSELTNVVDKTITAPLCVSIEDFMIQHSGLVLAEPLHQLLTLFQIYRKFQPNEDFEKFYNWGNLILSDFNDIDKCLVLTDRLFRNLSAIKELEANYLPDPLQQEFWETIHEEIPGLLQHRFIELWEVYKKVYYEFRAELQKNGLAYTGMCYRSTAEGCLSNTVDFNADHYFFIGLNDLSRAEEVIITSLLESSKATVYWDTDEWYLDNTQEEAGYYIRRSLKNLPPHEFLPPVNSLKKENKNCHIIGVPLQVGQAKAFGLELKDFFSKNPGGTTAIVLPDENLLIPVLHSLPEHTNHINITAGYPLQNTAIYAFLDIVLSLQHNYQQADHAFYFKDVLQILSHPFIQCREHERINATIKSIEKNNNVFIPAYQLHFEECDLTAKLFRHVSNPLDLTIYFRSIIADLKKNNKIAGNDPVFFSEFDKILNHLQSVINTGIADITTNTWIKLYREAIRNTKIQMTFQNENGLQIMGLLETRCLDFDNVFILSVNEGVLPASKKEHSYIPYDLRKAFGLPVSDEKDSLYAYYFYRLLQGASNIFLFYNTETGIKGEEKSRYIRQIEQYLSKANPNFTLSYRNYTLPIIQQEAEPIIIQKDEVFYKEFQIKNGKTGISPSLISSYFVCPLQFLFNYTMHLETLKEVNEEWEARDFGQFYHSLMEEIYSDMEGQVITEPFLLEKSLTLDLLLKKVFTKYEQSKSDVIQNRNSLMVETLKILAEKAIEADLEYTPFTLVALESVNTYSLPLDNPDFPEVRLYGIIDRIDEKDGQYRIVDYKTGHVERLNFNYNDPVTDFSTIINKDNKEAFQTLFYSYLFLKNNPLNEITPALLPLKRVAEGYKEVNKDQVFNREEADKFENKLREIILFILDKEQAIRQTADTLFCTFCDYRHICLR